MTQNQPKKDLNFLDPKTLWLFFISYFFRLAIYIPLMIVFVYVFFLIKLMENQPRGSTFDPFNFATAPLPWFILYTMLATIFAYIFAQLTYKNWKYELTEDALRIEKGIIWKKYVSIPYEKIQNVDILRGIMARLLGLSDLQIQTAGISGYSLTEGRLPGLGIDVAEQLRDNLVKRSNGKSGI